MKLYRIDKRAEAGTSFGFEFFGNKRDAEKAARDWLALRASSDAGGASEDIIDCNIEAIQITPTRDGILQALARYAGHPDNG